LTVIDLSMSGLSCLLARTDPGRRFSSLSSAPVIYYTVLLMMIIRFTP
jgi:hypothetical protein